MIPSPYASDKGHLNPIARGGGRLCCRIVIEARRYGEGIDREVPPVCAVHLQRRRREQGRR
jgi:hypothetical protein